MSVLSATGGSAARFTALRSELDTLQRQFGTGLKAETYGGLGTGRVGSLDIRGRQATLAGYQGAIADASLRLTVMDKAVTRLSALRDETRSSLLPGPVPRSLDGRTLVQSGAQNRLKEAIDLLNQDVAGRHVFAGRAADAAPVEEYARIMDGDSATARDGLRTLIQERKAADRGDGLGRLKAPVRTGTSVALAEADDAGVRANFGFRLAGAAASGSGAITAAPPTGDPATLAFDVAALPADGDTVSVTLALRDGTTETITLTARATSTGEDTFRIGATSESTAEALGGALDAALRRRADTALAASSATVASEDFFVATSTAPPRRIAGTPAAATGFEPAATARRTVLWYRGEDSASPRETAPVRIDAATSIGTGAQANEPAIRTLLAALGALAAEAPVVNDTGQHAALSERVSRAVSADPQAPALTSIATELGVAHASLAAAGERHSATSAVLEDALAGIEQANPESTAAALLSLQTRLQASYQVTAMMSRLSLVNYL